jgi:nucleoside-diphosphate-sugar epimerase
MMDSPVLVTGATGFTGGHLARALAAAGCAVRALVRPTTDAEPLTKAGYQVVRGDLRDADAVRRAVDGVEKVYHIAAAFRLAGQPDDYYWDCNVLGTKNLLEAAKRCGVERFIHCSTIGVHGDVGSEPIDETGPFNPGDVYQRTKVEAERLASQAFAEGLPGVIFRPGGIYGPGDTRFLKLFRAIARKRFFMLGSGEVRYQLIYIDDLVDGILLCGAKESALGNTYILTGETAITLNEFARLVGEAVGMIYKHPKLPLWPAVVAAHVCEAVCTPFRINPPIFPRRLDFFRKERAFRIDKAKRELGFQPKVEPAEGLKRTADWYFEQGLLDRPKELQTTTLRAI